MVKTFSKSQLFISVVPKKVFSHTAKKKTIKPHNHGFVLNGFLSFEIARVKFIFSIGFDLFLFSGKDTKIHTIFNRFVFLLFLYSEISNFDVSKN